jgi:hypothetical protein
MPAGQRGHGSPCSVPPRRRTSSTLSDMTSLERSRAERSRGLGTRLATLLPIEGEREDQVEGTGRGVRAVIPVAAEGAAGIPGRDSSEVLSGRSPGDESTETKPSRLRRDQRIFVGLEILQSLLPVELCAYVHQRRKGAPRVQIRLTEGALGSPEDVFDLSDTLKGLFESGQCGPSIVVGHFVCLAVATGGNGSRGIHVLGRRSSPLCARDRLLAQRFCRLLSPSLHKRA